MTEATKERKRPREVNDDRAEQIIVLTQSLDATVTQQQQTISEQAQTIAEQQEEIERLQEIIDEGGGVDPVPPDPDMRKPDVYMLPAATGDGSGSSPENAAAYSTLPG